MKQMSKRKLYLENLEKRYKESQETWKAKIKSEPKKFKRFWKWVWYLIAFPWVWLFYNCRDWRSAICILISLALLSASVWIFYLLAIITGWNTPFAKTCIGIGSAVWVWWLSPIGSPFILLTTTTAIGIKALFNKIKDSCKKKNNN